MRVNHVEKCRKSPGNCGGCSREIKAGEPYKWAKGRYTGKKIRCGSCAFRQSDLTGSDKLARVYEAQETLEDFIAGWETDGSIGDVQDACGTAAEQIREVAQEYADAAEAMGSAGEEMQEKADNLEGWADEIEDAGNQGDEFEVSFEDNIECPKCHGGKGEDADTKSAEHMKDGTYLCKNCDHEFEIPEDEQKNEDGQTRQEWADEIRARVEDAIGNCPL